MTLSGSLHRVYVVVLATAVMLPVVILAVGGLGTRYFTDDYCIYNEVVESNPIAKTAEWFGNSGGRLSQFLFMTVAFKLGVTFAGLAPVLLLSFWLFSMTWACIECARSFGFSTIWMITAGHFALCATVVATPQPLQSLYWLTGILTYLLPLPLLTCALAAVLRANRKGPRRTLVIAASFLIFVACLFNEPTAFLVCALIALTNIVVFMRSTSRPLLASFRLPSVAATLATLLLVMAPGNSIRQESFTSLKSLADAILASTGYSLLFIATTAAFNPLGSIGAWFIGYATEQLRPHKKTKSAKFGPLMLAGSVLGTMAFMLPGLYATSAPPPARSFVVPLFLQFVALVLFGSWCRTHVFPVRAFSHRLVAGTAVVLAVCHGLWAIPRTVTISSYMLNFGSEWDTRVSLISNQQATGATHAVVPAFEHDAATANGLESIGEDPRFWVNVCAAHYFELETLSADHSG